MDMHSLEYSELRILSEEVKGTAPGPEASFLKIRGSELQQRISELTLEAVGHFGLLKSNENNLNKVMNTIQDQNIQIIPELII